MILQAFRLLPLPASWREALFHRMPLRWRERAWAELRSALKAARET